MFYIDSSVVLLTLFYIDSSVVLLTLFYIDSSVVLLTLFYIDSGVVLLTLFYIDSSVVLLTLFYIDSSVVLLTLFYIDSSVVLLTLFYIDSSLWGSSWLMPEACAFILKVPNQGALNFCNSFCIKCCGKELRIEEIRPEDGFPIVIFNIILEIIHAGYIAMNQT